MATSAASIVLGQRSCSKGWRAEGSLWDIGGGNLQAALIAGLTRLRDARDERRAAAESQIPPMIWFVLIAGGAMTLMCAALLGTSDLRLHLAMTSLLSLSGVLVLVMIVALGHPFQGELRVTPKAFATKEGSWPGDDRSRCADSSIGSRRGEAAACRTLFG